MVGEFDIRATAATHLPVRFNVGMTFTILERDSGEESEVLVWMPRDTMELWGFGWMEEDVDPGVAQILSLLGLGKILDLLHTEDRLPTEVAVRSDRFGAQRPRLKKKCPYQEERDFALFCRVAAMEDPHGGETNGLLCEGCHMPDATIACSDILSPRTSWYPGDSEAGVRDLVQSMCRAGNDPGTGADCLPGRKGCWVKTIEVL